MKIYIVFISILVISCNNRNKSVAEKNSNLKVDTLSFSLRGFNSGHKLKLATDNQFIDEDYWAFCGGGGGAQKIYGTYKSENGKIILNPKTVHYIERPMFESDTLLEKWITEYNPDSLKIKTEYFLVEWRQNKYLLSEKLTPVIEKENDFIRFAQYFNSESRRFKFDGFLYIDEEDATDTINSDFDYNQIPSKWRKYFLYKPIAIEIKRVERLEKEKDDVADGYYCRVEINKGIKDSIYNGLYFKNKESDLTLFIDSTFQNKSYSTIYMFKDEKPNDLIGLELRTRWE